MENNELEIIKEKYKSEFRNTYMYNEALRSVYKLQHAGLVQEYLDAYKIVSCDNEEFKKTTIYIDALKKVYELGSSSIVKEFLESLNILSMASIPRNYSNGEEYYIQLEILNKVLDLVDLKGSSNIYLCYGTYKFQRFNNDLINEVEVERFDDSATHKVYRNIENGKSIKLAINNCDKFESDNIVIYPEGKMIDIDKYYEMLRNLYITKCMSSDIVSATQEFSLKR